MPTPVGHTLAAVAARALSREISPVPLADPWLWLAVFAANAPDLDFLPGLVRGNESLFHRGAVILAAAVPAGAFPVTRSRKKSVLAGRDPAPPHGIQFFWPLSDGFTSWKWYLFPNLDRHPFDWSLPGRALPVAAAEMLLMAPFLFAARTWRRRGDPGRVPS